MSFIAPAGTPVSAADLAIGLTRGTVQRDAGELLSRLLADHSRQQRCWLLCTGRAAMTVILSAMRDAAAASGRNEVIVPAYTCYSVPASIAKAGLQPRLCDIDPDTLSYDLDGLRRFDGSRVLAIVSANLYGIPNALAEIESWARQSGAFMLDDAAQALGAQCGTRPVGGFGDAGLYSFDKGKNITSMDGGAIVAKDGELAHHIERQYSQLPGPRGLQTLIVAAKLGVYAALLKPRYYGIVEKLPFLGLGRTVYDTTYPLTRYSQTLAGVAHRLYRRLPALTQARSRNAETTLARIRDLSGIRTIKLMPGSSAAYTRLPLRVTNAAARESVLAALRAAGIGATASYPNALSDVPDVARMLPPEDLASPGAREVAATIMTLPTHPYCPPDLPERVERALSRALG